MCVCIYVYIYHHFEKDEFYELYICIKNNTLSFFKYRRKIGRVLLGTIVPVQREN